MDNFIKLTMKESQRYDIIQMLIAKKIKTEEARKMIGLKSKRQVRRIRARVEKEGMKGLAHKNRGQPSNRGYTQEFKDQIIKIYKEEYYDFGPTFAAEKLAENHQIKVSSEWLRRLLISEGLWKAKSRKKPKKRRVWRKRRVNYGEMQQFDGSYHKWFEERGEECCLLLAVDDAAGKITKAKFDKHEGVIPVFKFWEEYVEDKGVPVEIYLDKFSTYKINHKSAQDNKDLMTQFQRAMNQIGVKLITANSPQAKGRVERMNATLQDRLVKEMRLKKISNIEEANEFLEKEFIPKFNKRFAVTPKEKNNLHKKIDKKLNQNYLRYSQFKKLEK
jgi:transposase